MSIHISPILLILWVIYFPSFNKSTNDELTSYQEVSVKNMGNKVVYGPQILPGIVRGSPNTFTFLYLNSYASCFSAIFFIKMC